MGEIVIRKAAESDFDFFYLIKCEDDNIYWSGHTARPHRDTLYHFFSVNVLSQDISSKRTIFIAEEKPGGPCVGYLYFDPIERSSAEISIGIMEAFSGRGYGRQAVCALCNLAKSFGFRSIHALVREDNMRSQKMFQHAGFENSDVFRLQFIPNQNKEMKMLTFIKLL